MRGGPGLPAAVVARLLCAGRIRTALHDGRGTVRDLGRSHRIVSERQFRALLLRDGGCAHPGCGSRHRPEAHHVRHGSAAAAPTSPISCCCARRTITRITAATSRSSPARAAASGFVRGHGRELERRPDPARLLDTAGRVGDAVPADSGVTELAGGARLDRDWAVAVLAGRRERRRPVHGEPGQVA